jgi:hypothetical protein
MNNWPITVETNAGWTYIGIPDRLGDGQPLRADDRFPTLEQLAGDNWSGAILRQLLAEPRAWAWWTRTESYKGAGLSGQRASDRIDPAALTTVAARRWLLQGMTLAFIPGPDASARDAVLEWAGADSEQIPDAIWTATDDSPWEPDAIMSWCRDPTTWTSAASAREQPAERIVILFDGKMFCALRSAAAAATLSRLHDLAARWGLSVIPGYSEYAWPKVRAG